MHRTITPTRVLLLAAMVALGACGGDDSNDPENLSVGDFISGVSTNIVVVARAPAVLHPGRPPKVGRIGVTGSSLRDPISAVAHDGDVPSTSGAAAINLSENSTPLQGEPYRLGVAAGTGFTTAFVWIDGVDGYWELTLPSSVTTAELVLGLANNPPENNFSIVTAVGTGGAVGGVADIEVEPRDLADADFAATVDWTGASDVDIHVIDPNGFEVFYGAVESPEGGRLDLDSNAACNIDNVNTETISWPDGTAPAGDYKVVIDYYDDCDVESSTYTVLVRRKGRAAANVAARTFTGDYTANLPDTVGTYTFP